MSETIITLPGVSSLELLMPVAWTLVLTSPDPSAGISANYIVDEFGNVLADLTGEELVYV